MGQDWVKGVLEQKTQATPGRKREGPCFPGPAKFGRAYLLLVSGHWQGHQLAGECHMDKEEWPSPFHYP